MYIFSTSAFTSTLRYSTSLSIFYLLECIKYNYCVGKLSIFEIRLSTDMFIKRWLYIILTRSRSFITLYDQVNHPAWCLKHLDIGYGDPSVVVKILRASASSLVSFRLWDSDFSDELLSVLLQLHGKTLQRVSIGKCEMFFLKAKVEAVLSRCPGLKSLEVFNCDPKAGIAMTEERQVRWTGPEGRVFNVFISEQPRWKFVDREGIAKVVYVTRISNTDQHDLWSCLDLMLRDQVEGLLRFVAH